MKEDAIRDLIHQKKYQDCIDACKNLLLDQPKNFEALHLLGLALNSSGNFSEAIVALEQAASLRPDDPVIHFNLSESFRKNGLLLEATGSCLIGLNLKQECSEGWNLLGLALKESGKTEEALASFLKSKKFDENYFPSHLNLGLLYKETGNLVESLKYFSSALRLMPNSFSANYNMGLLLAQKGEHGSSIFYFEKAIGVEPASVEAHYNFGLAWFVLGDFSKARNEFFRAMRLNHNFPEAYFMLGMTQKSEGKFLSAIKWCSMSCKIDSINLQAWVELANLYQKIDLPENAINCYKNLMALSGSDCPDIHIDLGWAYQENEQPERAEEQYLVAKAMQPASPRVHFALGGLYQEAGKMAAAEKALREAISLQPKYPAAYARLATLLKKKLPTKDLSNLEELLNDSNLDRDSRERLLFAVAQVYDAIPNYSKAAIALEEANSMALRTRLASHSAYSPESHTVLVNGLVGAFDHHFFERLASCGHRTTRPIFIIGLPRSGTTLVEHILASHPQVYGGGERLFARRAFDNSPALLRSTKKPLEIMSTLDKFDLNLLAIDYLGNINTLDFGIHDKITDKLPENYIYFGLLAAMFPSATFIHCRRNNRDVAISCWMSDFRGVRWSNSFEHIGSRFAHYRHLMDHWNSVLPNRLITIDYEALITDFEPTAHELLSKCQLTWSKNCLQFYNSNRSVRTASLSQVREPIYKSSLSRWKNYEGLLDELFKLVPDVVA